jgi:hypothetical protein
LLNRYRVVKPYRGFESLRLRHFRTERASFRRFSASDGGKGAQKLIFRSFDEHLALGKGAQVIAPVAATVEPHSLARGGGESLYHLRRDGLMVELSSMAAPARNRLWLGHEWRAGHLCGLSTPRIVQIGHAGLNGVVEAFQA